MRVDKPGREDLARGVDHPIDTIGRDSRFDRFDHALFDQQIANLIQSRGRINDSSILDEDRGFGSAGHIERICEDIRVGIVEKQTYATCRLIEADSGV